MTKGAISKSRPKYSWKMTIFQFLLWAIPTYIGYYGWGTNPLVWIFNL